MIEEWVESYHIRRFKKKAIPVGTTCTLMNYKPSKSESIDLIVKIEGYLADDSMLPYVILVSLVQGHSLPSYIAIETLHNLEGAGERLYNEAMHEIMLSAHLKYEKHYYIAEINRLFNSTIVPVKKKELKINMKFLKT